MSKNNPQKTIGWAVVLVVGITDNRVKLLFEEVENADVFQNYIGLTFEYGTKTIRKAHVIKGKKYPITFDVQTGFISFVDGRRYIILVDFLNNPPYIKSGSPKAYLDRLRNQNILVKSKLVYRVRFRSASEDVESVQVTDVLDNIMIRMARHLGVDPTDHLQSNAAEWFEKLGEDYYKPLKVRPLLPFMDESMVAAILRSTK